MQPWVQPPCDEGSVSAIRATSAQYLMHSGLCRQRRQTQPLTIPPGTSVEAALKLVLQLPAVGSKRFLTTKLDRCVTGASLASSTDACKRLDSLHAAVMGCSVCSVCTITGASVMLQSWQAEVLPLTHMSAHYWLRQAADGPAATTT